MAQVMMHNVLSKKLNILKRIIPAEALSPRHPSNNKDRVGDDDDPEASNEDESRFSPPCLAGSNQPCRYQGKTVYLYLRVIEFLIADRPFCTKAWKELSIMSPGAVLRRSVVSVTRNTHCGLCRRRRG